eukprot:CAMPEP_0181218570 /NCGR_PEP_ID=MMETSP1096-20121128/27766_1 /TAXON_ID=156174 ORGANISM="Chrysochromulina ericina, Strain CCMP281" /NCGR_SAMPLE_ID=MMETSP1096 /ASSEMBLY_ACC=CAM_ASM_000453 /LENGTH=160 /DNA_ID=CAMNT_0023310799 /DNA_START=75 /DNA_END=557 /DNA_ORIENTATION=-
MGLPIFAPSLRLLIEWEHAQKVMTERVYWSATTSPLRQPPTPNPNSRELPSLWHWLNLSDPYTFPHVTYFDSAADLVHQMQAADLGAISSRMQRHSAQTGRAVRARWRRVLSSLFDGSPHGSWPSGRNFDEALRERFGVALPLEEPDCRRRSQPEQGQWH